MLLAEMAVGDKHPFRPLDARLSAAMHAKGTWHSCVQGIRRMPAALQVLLAEELGTDELPHHTMPSCLLTSLLAHAGYSQGLDAMLRIDEVGISALQRLARDMIPMPTLRELSMSIGSEAVIDGSATMQSPKAALCQIFAHMPALSVLCLRVEHAANLDLAFPASLQKLDLSGSVLMQYMTQTRSRSELIAGLRSVLAAMASLSQLQKVVLPRDKYCKELVRVPAWDEAMPEKWAEDGRGVVVGFETYVRRY